MGEAIREQLYKLDEQRLPALILDDLTRMGKTDTAARQTVSQLARSLPYQKAAMVGAGGPLMKYGTALLLQAIGMGRKIKYFEDRGQAIAWLKR